MKIDRRSIVQRASVIVAVVGLMWLLYAIRIMMPASVERSMVIGIVPRSGEGLAGIAAAPFFHASFSHLMANTIPLIALSALVLLSDVSVYASVFAMTALIAGAGTWLFGAPGTMHVGASGVIFGMIGYLIARGFFDRRVVSVAIGVVVALLYGGAVRSTLIPAAGVSWSGHLFGFAGGILAARFLAKRSDGRWVVQ